MNAKDTRFDYEKSVDFRGNPEKALDFVRRVFADENFAISPIHNASFDAANHRMMMSNHENALRAVSRATVRVAGSSLTIQTEIRNGRKLFRILGICIFSLAVVMPVTFMVAGAPRPAFWAGVLPVAPWIVILPIMRRMTDSAARQALDILIQNAANAA